MPLERDDFQERALQAVRFLWHTYLLNRTEKDFADLFAAVSEKLVLIGTGKHEFYQSGAAAIAAVGQDQADARGVEFEIVDEWYALQPIDDDACVVYGTFWAREKAGSRRPLVADMDTRFSVVCRRNGERVELCHIHHSVPNMDQAQNEYYPKSITQKANEALEQYAALQNRARSDSLTGLYNRAYAEAFIEDYLTHGPGRGVFFMIDLDDFKAVNDTLGHLAGDQVLRKFAAVLSSVFRAGDFLARIGGDEFAVLMMPPEHAAGAESAGTKEACIKAASRRAWEVIARFRRSMAEDEGMPDAGCSIGLAVAPDDGTTFRALYQHADEALYALKKSRKGGVAYRPRGGKTVRAS